MNYKIDPNFFREDIPELRTYNRRSYVVPGLTKERIVTGAFGYRKKFFYGGVESEFHVKPIHYLGLDKKWHPLERVASYFGNKNGMILKSGWEDEVDMGYLAWYLKRQKLINGKGIQVETPITYLGRRVNGITLPLALNGSITVYPDPNPETTTVDGSVSDDRTDGTLQTAWDTAHDSTSGNGGGTSDSNATQGSCVMSAEVSGTTHRVIIQHGYWLFDTSSIGAGQQVDSGTISIYATSTNNGDADAQAYIRLVSCTPASNTAIVAADFDQADSVNSPAAHATDVTIASWTTGAYQAMTLNATGRADVAMEGVTKFAMREGHDVEDVVLAVDSTNRLDDVRMAETTGTASDPKLNIIHSVVAAATGFMTLNTKFWG